VERLTDGIDAQLAGDLARRVAPHPIGDDEEVVVLQDGVGVFVVLALQTRVCAAHRRDQDERVRPGRLLLFVDIDRHLAHDVYAGVVANLRVRVELRLVVLGLRQHHDDPDHQAQDHDGGHDVEHVRVRHQ